MKKLMLFLACLVFFKNVYGNDMHNLWDKSYQKILMKKVGEKLPELTDYPVFKFPNQESIALPDYFPDSKVLIFGYGSLINKQSAGRSLGLKVLETMQPAIGFGAKRVFNYQATKTTHWGANQDHKEKAMLNLMPAANMSAIANGVLFEVDRQDLANLVRREVGYDLVPIPVALWQDAVSQDSDIEIRVAYTFIASSELRENTIYISTEYYPVRGYMHAIQEGASDWGIQFSDFWNNTTYLADGTTPLKAWDGETFHGVLCTKQPNG